jgi:hypothetical protein
MKRFMQDAPESYQVTPGIDGQLLSYSFFRQNLQLDTPGSTCWRIMGISEKNDRVCTQPGCDIHTSPWLSHGPNRNRWFTDVYR